MTAASTKTTTQPDRYASRSSDRRRMTRQALVVAALLAACAPSHAFVAPGGGTSRHRLTALPLTQHEEWGIPHTSDLPPFSNNGIHKSLPNGGQVALVGAGPGDPDLLTLSAARFLSDPDALVVADRLVSPEILQLVRGELKTARKWPGCAEVAQDELYAWCHEGLAAGRTVIRLKIGDPFVFGRGGEEVLQFRKWGVEATVVPVRDNERNPVGTTLGTTLLFLTNTHTHTHHSFHATPIQGVSAAFSAPLLGSIPVTHRGVANQVVMSTGYGREGSCPDLIQYHPEQTLVFLMAVGRLEELTERLIRLAGYPSKTPVAIVEKAGCPDQRTVTGNMLTIAALAKQHKVKPPSTIVIGEVVNVLLMDEVTGEAVTGLIQNSTMSGVC
jgi:uroporphyrin-III C-methyltransferase